MEGQCYPVNENVVFGIDIVIHVLILFSIVSLFFVFYVSKIETDTINSQIIKNLNNAIDGGLSSVNPKIKTVLNDIGKSQIYQKIKNSYQAENSYRETNNKWLFKTIYMSIGFLLIITVLSTLILTKQCNKCINVKEILVINFVTFIFIGIVEYMFFTHVGEKYVPSKPSEIADTFFDRIQ